jgi:ubiquitin-activating enzyme E1 C
MDELLAAEANEAFKIATKASFSLNNYMMYNGVTGLYTYTFQYEKKETCPVCGAKGTVFEVDGNLKLEDFMDLLKDDPR